MQVTNQPAHSERVLGIVGRGEIIPAQVVSGCLCWFSLSSMDLSVFHNCSFYIFLSVCY